jgi:hypothetical protein
MQPSPVLEQSADRMALMPGGYIVKDASAGRCGVMFRFPCQPNMAVVRLST